MKPGLHHVVLINSGSVPARAAARGAVPVPLGARQCGLQAVIVDWKVLRGHPGHLRGRSAPARTARLRDPVPATERL
jgi:hypothetical protein